jgi:hypothetical protein
VQALIFETSPRGRRFRSFNPEVAMTPAIGIGFLSLTGNIFIAYIAFLFQQQKLQDEIARQCKGMKGER